MSESWLMQIVSDRWFVAVAAFCLGLLTGWIVWARRQMNNEAAPDIEGHLEHTDTQIQDTPPQYTQNQSDQQETLDALASELENAQKMLEESQAESDAYSDILGDLDEAVKRANGRLKLIIKAIKRQ